MKTYQSNTTSSPIYVGGVMIPAGEGRWVDEPGAAAPAVPVQETDPEPARPDIEQFRARSVKEILETITARDEFGAPRIAREVIEALASAEEAQEKPRSTLLAAIEEEWLRRAAEAAKAAEDAKAAGAENGGGTGTDGASSQAPGG